MNLHQPPEDKARMPEYQVAVMTARIKDGKAVQFRAHSDLSRGWRDVEPDDQRWLWDRNDYRVKPTTVREWLEQLPDGYRERALKNRKTLGPTNSVETRGSLASAILTAFSWNDSPEGLDFWDKVHDHYCGKGPLPSLPIAEGHNPGNLTEEQVETSKGWRLLERDEIHDGGESTTDLQVWSLGSWSTYPVYGAYIDGHYRTKKPKGFFLPKTQRQKDEEAFKAWQGSGEWCPQTVWHAACEYARR